MAVFHDEVEIEDFEYDEESETYLYPCPCGDQFQITKVGRTTFILRNSRLDFKVLNWSSLIGASIYYIFRKLSSERFYTCTTAVLAKCTHKSAYVTVYVYSAKWLCDKSTSRLKL